MADCGLPSNRIVQAPLQDYNCDQQNQIKPAQTVVDGCPVLPKLQCHEVQMGQDARLLWNFKNPQGEFINLMNCNGGSCNSVSSQPPEPFDPLGTPCGATLRMRELTGLDPINDPIYTINVSVLDATTGLVRADSLPDKIVRFPGIYMEEWAFFTEDGRMLFSNQSCTFVRRGLFGVDSDPYRRNFGPQLWKKLGWPCVTTRQPTTCCWTTLSLMRLKLARPCYGLSCIGTRRRHRCSQF